MIRWTYREVSRGKAPERLVLSLGLLTVVGLALLLMFGLEELRLENLILSALAGIVSLKADAVATNLAMAVVITVPLLLVLRPLSNLVLMAYYRYRDRNVPPTPENLAVHQAEASKAWTWPYSLLVGAFDFTAAFLVFHGVLEPFEDVLPEDAVKLIVFAGTIACLVFAERRVTRASRAMASYWPGNSLMINAVLDGMMDASIPERMRNEIGRAKVATVIRLGVVVTPRWAARIVAGIDLRTKVKLFSAFLNSAIHGMLSALSFGIASTVANELGNVSSQFAGGKGDALVAQLREPGAAHPRFVVEIVCALLCVAFSILSILILAE